MNLDIQCQSQSSSAMQASKANILGTTTVGAITTGATFTGGSVLTPSDGNARPLSLSSGRFGCGFGFRFGWRFWLICLYDTFFLGVERGAPPVYYEGLVGHESLARPCGDLVSHSQTSPGTVDCSSPARARSLASSISRYWSWKKGEVFDTRINWPGLGFLSSEVAAEFLFLPSTDIYCFHSYCFYSC